MVGVDLSLFYLMFSLAIRWNRGGDYGLGLGWVGLGWVVGSGLFVFGYWYWYFMFLRRFEVWLWLWWGYVCVGF